MERNKFLKKETKTFAVVTSVLIAIALIVLVVIGLMGGNFINISVIGSSVIVFVVGIFVGSMQIRVFSDYKNQKKFLCADGIFNICLTILVAITALIFVLVQNSKVDVRYFIFVFAMAFAIWKIIISVFAFKNKQYNAFLELLIALFWILSGVGVLLTSGISENLGLYILCVSNYLLGIVTIFYILFSYVFKEPIFLETSMAVELLKKEEMEKQQRINRFNNRFNGYVEQQKEQQEESLEQKLEKLKNLKDKDFITAEEYERKKKEILDKEI